MKIAPFISQFSSMFGMPDFSADALTAKLDDILNVIRQVNDQFRNPVNIHKCIFFFQKQCQIVFYLIILFCLFFI